MEAVFKTPELVDLILQNFRVTPSEYRGRRSWQGPSRHISRKDLVSDKERRGTLYRVALTNRAISRMVLPILWSTIEGILPLLNLISKFEYNTSLWQWVLTRPLSEDDLQRFDTFAVMVRHIDIPVRRGQPSLVYPTIHPSALVEIFRLRAASPLVPCLQTLSVDDACDYATLFLAETLECVRIVRSGNAKTFRQSDDPPRPSVWNLLALLQTRAPFVEELYVGSPPSPSNLYDILRLKHLRVLTLDISRASWLVDERARYQFFKDLECLPKLQALNIGQLLEDSRDRRAPLLAPGLYSYAFPALESLTFQGFEGYLHKILPRFCDTPNLRCLVFDQSDMLWGRDDHLGEEEEHNFKTALSLLATTHFRSLTCLCIWDGAETVLNAADLAPLLQISGMEHFEFFKTIFHGFTDELVQRMASAWPQLETFRLYSERTPYSQVGPTLAAIQIFACHCPKLRRLSLCLDPVVRSPEDSDPGTLHRLDQLTIFSFYTNAVIGKANVPAVARHLSATFPALLFAFIELDDWSIESEDDWMAVCRALSAGRTYEEFCQLREIFRLYVTSRTVNPVVVDIEPNCEH